MTYTIKTSDEPFILTSMPSQVDLTGFSTSIFESKTNPKKRNHIVAIESETLEYVGDSKESECLPTQYICAKFNKKTKTLEIHPTSLVQLSLTVKSLKDNQESRIIGEKTGEARNDLGKTFGTKKKRQTIKSREENKIQVGSISQVAAAIQQNIDQNVESIPTREYIRNETDSERPIPPFNPSATTPQDVYDIHSIIPVDIMKEIPVHEMKHFKLKEEMKNYLSYIHPSIYVLNTMHRLFQEKKSKQIKYLLYATYLFSFYAIKPNRLNKLMSAQRDVEKQGVSKPHQLSRLMGDAPVLIIESILSQFSETTQSGNVITFIKPAKLIDKLIAYIFAIVLIVEEFSIDPEIIVKDLGIPLSKGLDIFKELGCRVESKRGDHQNSKQVMLRLPLVFPNRTR